jgi:hypothetical protein
VNREYIALLCVVIGTALAAVSASTTVLRVMALAIAVIAAVALLPVSGMGGRSPLINDVGTRRQNGRPSRGPDPSLKHAPE